MNSRGSSPNKTEQSHDLIHQCHDLTHCQFCPDHHLTYNPNLGPVAYITERHYRIPSSNLVLANSQQSTAQSIMNTTSSNAFLTVPPPIQPVERVIRVISPVRNRFQLSPARTVQRIVSISPIRRTTATSLITLPNISQVYQTNPIIIRSPIQQGKRSQRLRYISTPSPIRVNTLSTAITSSGRSPQRARVYLHSVSPPRRRHFLTLSPVKNDDSSKIKILDFEQMQVKGNNNIPYSGQVTSLSSRKQSDSIHFIGQQRKFSDVSTFTAGTQTSRINDPNLKILIQGAQASYINRRKESTSPLFQKSIDSFEDVSISGKTPKFSENLQQQQNGANKFKIHKSGNSMSKQQAEQQKRNSILEVPEINLEVSRTKSGKKQKNQGQNSFSKLPEQEEEKKEGEPTPQQQNIFKKQNPQTAEQKLLKTPGNIENAIDGSVLQQQMEDKQNSDNFINKKKQMKRDDLPKSELRKRIDDYNKNFDNEDAFETQKLKDQLQLTTPARATLEVPNIKFTPLKKSPNKIIIKATPSRENTEKIQTQYKNQEKILKQMGQSSKSCLGILKETINFIGENTKSPQKKSTNLEALNDVLDQKDV